MFEDSLFDSGGAAAGRKSWPQALSFAIEMFLIGLLVLLPLIYTQALPQRQLMSFVETPLPPPGRAPIPPQSAHAEIRNSHQASELDDNVLRAPSRIPRTTQIVRDEPATSEGPPNLDGYVQGGIPHGVPNALVSEIARPVTTSAPTQKVRVSSGVAQGMLVHRVKPQYPPLAIQARIQGTVVLQAVIGRDGTVRDLRLVSGHPLLAPAAIDAVKQWRYRPYLLNSEPVEVDTQINVNFTLGSG